MKRRDLLKFGFYGTLAVAGATSFLKIYKHSTGVRKILHYPKPILRKISRPVEIVDNKIISLSRQMIATLRYHSLIGFFTEAFLSKGLSAPQVGVSKRLIVCGLYGQIRVLVNPIVVEKQGVYKGYENCLSLPDNKRKIVSRPGFIRVWHKGLDNKEREMAATNEYAALLTHEIDHLNGTLYIDY